jgi:hypothetical protein
VRIAPLVDHNRVINCSLTSIDREQNERPGYHARARRQANGIAAAIPVSNVQPT